MPRYSLAPGERRELHGVAIANQSSVRVRVWFERVAASVAGALLIGDYHWKIDMQATDRPIHAQVYRDGGDRVRLIELSNFQ